MAMASIVPTSAVPTTCAGVAAGRRRPSPSRPARRWRRARKRAAARSSRGGGRSSADRPGARGRNSSLRLRTPRNRFSLALVRMTHSTRKVQRAHLVGLAPGDGDDGQPDRDDGQLVVQDRAAPIARSAASRCMPGGQRRLARAGDPAAQEAQLVPAPHQQRAGEGAVGVGDARARRAVCASADEARRRPAATTASGPSASAPCGRRSSSSTTPVLNHQMNSANSAASASSDMRGCGASSRYQAGATRTCAGSACCLHRQQVQPREGGRAGQRPAGLLQLADDAAARLGRVDAAAEMRNSRSRPARKAGWSMSSDSGNTCLRDLGGDAEHRVVVLGGVQAHRVVQHRAACGRARTSWRTRRAGRSGSTACWRRAAGAGCARMISANASPWRNSSLHQRSNQRKIGWKRLLRVALELAEDRDVARVADLLRQVGRVEDVLRLEVGVGLGALQEAQVDAEAEVLQATG